MDPEGYGAVIVCEIPDLAPSGLPPLDNYEPPVPVAAAGAAGGAGQAAPLQIQGPAAKPVMALKPEKLGFDSNLGQVRRWKQRFRAFHASSNLRVLSLPDQQAYLIACIDDEVANRINRLVTETTPLFPNQAQIPCCYDVIDSLFEEKIPLLLRRCLLYTSPSPRDLSTSRMPSSA